MALIDVIAEDGELDIIKYYYKTFKLLPSTKSIILGLLETRNVDEYIQWLKNLNIDLILNLDINLSVRLTDCNDLSIWKYLHSRYKIHPTHDQLMSIYKNGDFHVYNWILNNLQIDYD